MSVSLAVHLKAGIFKREPWILYIDQEKSALIALGSKGYQQIVDEWIKKNGGASGKRGEEECFRNYAERLTQKEVAELVQKHPGSVIFETGQIKKLEIIASMDSETRVYDEYERFILELPHDKYKGVIERETKLSDIQPLLETWLGSRYHYRTMDGFPFI